MTLVTINPSASNHDAWESGAAAVTLTGQVKVIVGTAWAGLLLPAVAVPAGATIDSATLYYKSASTSRDDPDFNWYASNVDSAGVFTTTNSDISGRARTTAVTQDTATAIGTTDYRTVTITTQIAEVTARGGWATGNNIALIGAARSANCDAWLSSWDTVGTTAWYVEINYTANKFTREITASGDDGAETTGGSMVLATTTMDGDSVGDIIGLMFRGVAVPAGATVTTAVLKVWPNDAGRHSPNVTIKGQYNPANFASTGSNFSSGRTLTTASVSWVATNIGTAAYKSSPELKTILQEIVDTSGWATGGSVAFFLSQNSSSGWLRIASWDHDTDPPAQLYVEWTTAKTIAPAGLAVGVGIGGATVWNHRVIAAVGTGDDDATESSGGVVSLSAIGRVDSDTPITGYILRALNLPTSTIIVTAAYARVYTYDTSLDSPNLTIRGQAAPANFAATSNNLSSRTKTSAGVTWSAADIGTGTKDSPDIKTVIQEIVNNGSWAATRDAALYLIDNGGGGALWIHVYESTGDNQPQLVIDWQFGSNIAPAGQAVGVTLGTATVGRGAVNLSPSGKAVTVGKGTATVGRGAVSLAPAGKAVGVALGTAAVGRGTVSLAPAGKAVGVALGTAAVGRGTVSLAPSGKAVTVGIGTAALSRKIVPAGKAVAVGMGTASVGRGAVAVAPSGQAVSVGIGTAAVSRAAWQIAPSGKAVGVGMGTASVGRGTVSVAPSGKAVGVGIGTATVAKVALLIAPAGREVAIGIGAVAVAVVGPQEIAPEGKAVVAGIGAPAVGLRGIGLNALTTMTSSDTGTNWTLEHVAGGVNRLAVVVMHAMRTTVGNLAASATYDGQAMTLVASQVYGDDPRTRTYGVFVFALVNPPLGAATVAVATVQTVRAMALAAMTLANVSQSAATAATGVANIVASTAATAGVAGALAGSWLVGGATMRGGDLTFTPGAGGTEAYELASGASTTADITATGGYRPLAAAGAATWLATANALDYGVAAAVEIRQALAVYAPGLAVGAVPGGVTVRVEAIRPAGLAVTAAPGAPVVALADALALYPAGLAAGLALGEATVEIGGVVVASAGLAVGLALGAPGVAQVVAPSGLAVSAALGAAGVVGSATALAVAGLAVGVGLGGARVWSHRLVVAVSEDGYETPAGAVFLATTSLNVEVSQPWVALASGPLDMPNAATVVGTRIEMQTITYDDPALEAGCELSAAPAAVAATAHNISGRTLAGPRARWEASNVGQGTVLSPNLAAPAQAVVNLPEWTPGARLMLVLHDLGAGGWLRWYSADAGLSFRPRVIVDWQFGAADLELVPAGLAVGATTGEVLVGAGAVNVTATGQAVGVAAGEAVVGGGAVGVMAVGLAVGLAVGEAAVVGGLLVVEAEGLAVAVAAGLPLVGTGVRPAGLLVAAEAGTHLVGRGGTEISPAGLAVAVAVGAPAVGRGGLVVAPAGLAVAVAVGAPTVGQLVQPAGQAVAVAAGIAVVVHVARPEGLAVAVVIGAPAVGRGVATIAPAGVGLAAAAGTHLVGRGGTEISPAGQVVGVGIGAPAVARRLEFVRPAGLTVGAVFGAAMVALARQPWRLTLGPRGNGLTLDERGRALTLDERGNELTVEDR